MHQNFTNKPLLGKFQSKVRLAKSAFSLKEWKHFLSFFWRILPFIVVFTLQKTRVTPRLRGLAKFLFMLLKLERYHGSLYTVKYLKACQISIQKYLSGNPLSSLREIEPKYPFLSLRNGLPVFIQSMDRAEIRRGNVKIIRLWMSLLNIYRVLKAPVVAKLNTITDGPIESSGKAQGRAIFGFQSVAVLCKRNYFFTTKRLQARSLRLSTKAGPNCKFSFAGILTDCAGFMRFPKLKEAFLLYCRATNSTAIESLFNRGCDLAVRCHSFDKEEATKLRRGMIHRTKGEYLIYPEQFMEYDTYPVRGVIKTVPIMDQGAFHTIELGSLVGLPEPAGKLRVIAIVDAWTQSIFEPLHKDLFSFLRTLPNDGTFDQDLAYKRAISKGQESGTIYCADLSAATDRLPKALQVEILNLLYRKGIGTIWGWLLDRRFITRFPLGELQGGETVTYGVGQPMGCLSSWAMLALCHHFILQYCCNNVGFDKNVWQTCYEILGDDIVIFNTDVYNEYVRVMDELGVETNPHKSLISDKRGSLTIEFAKRTAFEGQDVSGLSWKLFNSVIGWKDVVPLTISLLDRSLISKTSHLVRALLLKLDSKFRKKVRLSSYNRKTLLYLNNLTFSLVNYFARKGLIDSCTANMYVIDPRNRGEQSPVRAAVPLFTILQDILTLSKNLDHFRVTGYFDTAKLRLGARQCRAALVGAKLLPFWGHARDFRSIEAWRSFKGKVPHFIEKLIPMFVARRGFELSDLRDTPLDTDLWKYLYEVSLSLVYRGKDDEARASHIGTRLTQLFDSQNRTFEEIESVQSDLDLLTIKYDWISKLGERSLEVADAIPWTLKDVIAAIKLDASFSGLLQEDETLNLDTMLREQKLFVKEHGLARYIELSPGSKDEVSVLKLGKVPLIPEVKEQSLEDLLKDPKLLALKAIAQKRKAIKVALKSNVAKT